MGPASITDRSEPFSKSLKFSINLAASASYFFQYSFLFPQEFEGSSTSSGTSGQERGTSKPNNLSFLNIGTGKDLTIAELAKMISEIVGFKGDVVYDQLKPDGTPRKLLDVSRINKLGWKAKTGLRDGIKKTYEWFLARNN